MQTSSRFLILIYCLIILLWIWSAFDPSHYNWGFHLLAFYPRWYFFLCTGSLGIFLIPAIRNKLFHYFKTFIGWCSHRPKLLLYLLLGGIFAVAMVTFPAKIHLLGDGDIILQLTPKDPNIKDISANFRDHPLMYYTIRTTQLLIGGGLPVDVEKAYRLIDFISGLIFFLLIMIFVNYQIIVLFRIH